MNEYIAIIDDKEYRIKINKRTAPVNDNNSFLSSKTEKDSSEICLNAILEEYQHTVHRGEKLDNKVYILSTICGFIFIFITEIISRLANFELPSNRMQAWLINSYFIFTCVMSIIYLYTIFKLGILLTAKKTRRLTPDFLILNKVYDLDQKHTRIFIATQYIQSINDVNNYLEKRFTSFNNCAYRTAAVILIAFILHFLNLFITQ